MWKFGHRESVCPRSAVQATISAHTFSNSGASISSVNSKQQEVQGLSKFGPWMVVQRGGRRTVMSPRGRSGNSQSTGPNSVPNPLVHVE